MALTGEMRRAHIADVQRTLRIRLRHLLIESSRQLSWGEVHGEILGALEDMARCPAEEIRSRAAELRDLYCGPESDRLALKENSDDRT